MREWLLKDYEKAKVGRPKLASDDVLRKAEISIVLSFIVCVVMIFIFICNIKGLKPLNVLYKNTIQRLTATSSNTTGFIVKEKYDSSNDYILELTPSNKIKSYGGKYKYILYKLDKDNWKKIDEKIVDKKVNKIKIKVESLKNTNATYKVSVYILDSKKITRSFEPFSWKFVDSKKDSEKQAYKVFTVKGFYSPISNDEIKEAKKEAKNKITVYTNKEDSRKFFISVPKGIYKVNVKYTDDEEKEILLKKDENLTGTSSFIVPSTNKLSKVTIKIWQDSNIDKLKLSNWSLKKDKQNNDYITNTYMLKPNSKY